MTRISGCDGRYLSLAHQRRAWEELNAIFGEKTPDPPGPDPGPDPPEPDPMNYECVFVNSTTSWMSPGVEPYMVHFEIKPGVWRYGFRLPPNICLTFWSWPKSAFEWSPGLWHYRNGEFYNYYGLQVSVPSDSMGVLESVGYDPETRRYSYFCMYPKGTGSMSADTEPLEDGDSVVLVPVAFSLQEAYRWYTMFSTWYPRL